MLFETPNLDHEYLPVEGSDVFIKSALKIAYGEGYLPLKENRIGAIQSLSGTGALRLGLEFCKKFIENSKKTIKNLIKLFIMEKQRGNHYIFQNPVGQTIRTCA